MAKVALDPFPAGAFRIGEALVVTMTMDPPRTTTRTDRARSRELIAADLNAGENPKSSRQIKPRSFGLPDTVRPVLLITVPIPRSQISSQLYSTWDWLFATFVK